MADELKIPLDPFTDTGLTLLAKVYNSTGSQEGSTVAMSEDGPALYIGDFDVTIRSDGQYIVRFETNSPDKLYGTGSLYIRDGKEVSPEMYFNQALDTVANVTLVATTTTNTDMRGTDGANTVAPDNAGISSNGSAIAALNNVSASDVYTEFTSGNNEDVFKADVSGIPTNPLLNNDVRLDNLDATISSRSTFNASNDEVTTDSASRTASQATGFATPANVTATQTAIQSDISNLNDISPGEVNAEVDTALADYDAPTKPEMDAAFNEIKGTGWTDETLKDIRDNVSTVDLGTMPSEVTAIKLKTDNLNFIGNDVQSVSSNMRGTDGANTVTPTTTVDLAAAQAAIQNDISNLNNPSAEEIKDTILDEVL